MTDFKDDKNGSNGVMNSDVSNRDGSPGGQKVENHERHMDFEQTPDELAKSVGIDRATLPCTH